MNDNMDFILADILSHTHTIAMVGASSNWKRPSYFVMKYLLEQGYQVIPVNPTLQGQDILGQTVYGSLHDIPFPVDMVDVFRRVEECPQIARDAVAIGAKILWLQQKIISNEADMIATDAGLRVIMDRCPKIEHSRLNGLLGIHGFHSGVMTARRRSAPASKPAPRDGGLFKSQQLQTLAIHAGTAPDPATGARITPIYQTTAFVFDDAEHAAGLFNLQTPGNIYGRLSNPTTAALEQKLAALEGGLGATCCASGHAAQLLALFPLMQPGHRIIASTRLYGGTVTQFSKTFQRFGWHVDFVDTDDIDAVRVALAHEDARVLFAESLANPGGIVTDIEALSKCAKEFGVPLIIDSTMATPILCRPIDYGADIVVHSTTKFLSGHGQAMGGVVIDSGRFDWSSGRGFPALTEPEPAYHGISFFETFGPLSFTNYAHAVGLRDLGPTMAPMNAFLTLTGLETLALRMPAHVANAYKVALFLDNHPKVETVTYAKLTTSPWFKNAEKYMPEGPGSVFTFCIKGHYEDGAKLVAHCNLFSHLANIGDTRSLILHPASTTHRQLTEEQRQAAGIEENMLRLSIGLEHADDLIYDLEQALAVI